MQSKSNPSSIEPHRDEIALYCFAPLTETVKFLWWKWVPRYAWTLYPVPPDVTKFQEALEKTGSIGRF